MSEYEGMGGNAFYDRSKDLVPSCQKAIDAAEFWADQIKIPLFQIDKRPFFPKDLLFLSEVTMSATTKDCQTF